ncbi:uncharacterized protein TRIADDRAFT_61364 [Trichoplax adhaerens]|uniref:Uncharacterized protein n=1 Tax=Trichoplax adhaerens TaxID=10228 RepID=B3SAS6_TRIAD|nr:hypothetical protein TRIADDRAFT_61364 [Trichoplax adhaerens]EDV20156.1 hypothetical protein TRIADDRAFT_61364 [Trichoplax adhaerens]|eukprot:XP_002117317.1 hypothetical protein TRIADDRAFT_61364 [Trichoplax adhaerens]
MYTKFFSSNGIRKSQWFCLLCQWSWDTSLMHDYSHTTEQKYVQQKKKLLDDARRSSDSDDEDDHVPYENSKLRRIKYIFGKVWPVVVAQLLCCGVSYCIVPSIASRAISIYRGNNTLLTGPLFIPIVCFLLFAVADVVGRLTSRWILLPGQNQGILLLIISISRIIFIPLFMYCNVHPRRHLPVKIYSDIVYTILIVLLGISHGYINTLCSMYAPKRVPPKLSESAGAMAYLFLVIGVTVALISSV